MNIKELRAKGAFVDDKPVPTECVWRKTTPETGLPLLDENGEPVVEKFTVQVRRVSVGWLDRVRLLVKADGRASYTAALICGGILFDGEEMSYADAYRLDYGFSTALIVAFNKVNGIKETPEDTEAEASKN